METSTPNPIFNPSHSSTKTSAFYLPNSYNQKTSHTSNTSLQRQTTKCIIYNNQITYNKQINYNSQINYNNQITYNNRINYNNQIDYNYQITSSKSFNFNISTPPHSKFNSTYLYLQIKETSINKEYSSSNHCCLFENLKTITNNSRTPFFHHSVSYSSRLFPPILYFPSKVCIGNEEARLQI